MSLLGTLHLWGNHGVAQDSDMAEALLTPAANNGQAFASYGLGMMWFAGDSLYRYDGTQLYPYQLDPMSICSSFITGMAIDHDGILWITTEKGVCQYNANTDRFQPFSLPTGQTLSRNASTVSVSPSNEIYISFNIVLRYI